MMLFSFSYTPLSFYSQIVFLFLLLSPISPSLVLVPGAARLDWAQGLSCPNSNSGAKGEEREARNELRNWRRAVRLCESVHVCVCVFVGRVQLSHFSLLGNMKPDKQRNYAASYCRESYTGRDKNRGWRHRGADRKWKQDWGEPKGQGVDCWGVWICMTGRCERMEVWVDGSCVWSKSARLPYWTGLYSADIWFSTLNFKDLMHFNEIWLKAHYLNGIADIKQFASHSDSHHRPITNCQVSSDSKDRT